VPPRHVPPHPWAPRLRGSRGWHCHYPL